MAVKIEHRVGVPAPSTVIWDVLSDLDRWGEWNPLYPEISGLLRIALKLRIKETFPGAPPKVITPTVIDWVPNAQIIWGHAEVGGLVKRIRYIEIEQYDETDTACILSNGEIYDGLLGPRVAKPIRKRLKHGFETLNHAIVDRVRKVMAGEATAVGDRG
jgi:hypothetical protein